VPIVVAQPDGAHSAAFKKLAEAVDAEVLRTSEAKLKLPIV